MVEESGRRTSRTDSIAILALLRHLSLLTRIWWRQSRSVWLVVRTLRAGIGSLALLRVHGLLLVALRRWRILARLLLLALLRSVLAVAAVGRQWLTVCSVQLSVRRWVLAAPHRVRRHEGLSLRTHWREDTFLREAHAIGASTILGLLETRTSDLGDALAAKLRKDDAFQFSYLPTTTVSTRNGRALTWRRLSWRIAHLLRLRIRRWIHCLRWRQSAILVGMRGLQRRHRWRAWWWSSDARELFGDIISILSGQSRIDLSCHDDGCGALWCAGVGRRLVPEEKVAEGKVRKRSWKRSDADCVTERRADHVSWHDFLCARGTRDLHKQAGTSRFFFLTRGKLT